MLCSSPHTEKNKNPAHSSLFISNSDFHKYSTRQKDNLHISSIKSEKCGKIKTDFIAQENEKLPTKKLGVLQIHETDLHFLCFVNFHFYDYNIYIAISKNVVGENVTCQLSNGNCTTEKKCGY